jgi:geranylgeranyl reductase family protein
MPESQVIVVGGGPAGSSTAFFLAKHGVDVTILDRARFPRDKACSEYMSPEASRILERMNALDAIERGGAAQLNGMRVHAPNGAVIHGEFKASHGFRGHRDQGLAVRRTILDALLLERAQAAGARLIQQCRVTDLVRDSSGRIAGVVTSAASRERALTAQLVIGADGLRSVVGRRLGLIRNARWPKRIALVTHYENVDGIGEYGEMHVDRAGYFGVAPVGRNLFNVALVVPVSRAAELAIGRTEFLESWIAEHPRLAERFAYARRTDDVRATGPFASSTRRAWARGAALVGDAADFFDPFTGEGIYAALRGGEMLANYALESVCASPKVADGPLRAYETARRAEFSGKWRVERLIGTAVAFPALINRAARVLSRRRDMADLLVGVTGDFVPPREVLRTRYLLPFLLAR